jgi:hypothetical protein
MGIYLTEYIEPSLKEYFFRGVYYLIPNVDEFLVNVEIGGFMDPFGCLDYGKLTTIKDDPSVQYGIYLNLSLKPEYLLRVLAHELVHLEQFLTERLVMIEYPVYLWKSCKFARSIVVNKHLIPYENLPWEYEARQRTEEVLMAMRQEYAYGKNRICTV